MGPFCSYLSLGPKEPLTPNWREESLSEYGIRSVCKPKPAHRALSNEWFSNLQLYDMERMKTNTLHQYDE